VVLGRGLERRMVRPSSDFLGLRRQ